MAIIQYRYIKVTAFWMKLGVTILSFTETHNANSPPPLSPPSQSWQQSRHSSSLNQGGDGLSGTPTDGLVTPCHSVIKHPPPPTPTRILLAPLKEVPGSWVDRPAGVQEYRRKGAVDWVLCVGVCSHPGPLQLKVHQLILCQQPPPTPTHTPTHIHKEPNTDTHICLTLKVSLYSLEDGC